MSEPKHTGKFYRRIVGLFFNGDKRIIVSSKTKIYPLLIIIIFLAGCVSQPGKKEYLEIAKIPVSNESERLAKFSTYPVEKQIEIYLFAQYGVEGGNESFLRYLAFDGQNKIPAIIARIDAADDPGFKALLMRVLDFIDENCGCVADNPDFLNILERNEMQIDPADSEGIKIFKELYRKILLRMKLRYNETSLLGHSY
jgi:hypothetical protein